MLKKYIFKNILKESLISFHTKQNFFVENFNIYKKK
jgi:hypothetical protein